MATFSQSNRVRLAISEESTWGETPSSPTMDTLRYTGETLAHDKKTVMSATIRADRMHDFIAEVGASGKGNIDVEFSHAGMDKLLEGLMMNSFTGGGTRVLKNGTTLKSYAIEKGFLDIGEYIIATGCRVNTLSMDITPGAIVKCVFGLNAKGLFAASSEYGGSYAAAATADYYNATANVGTIVEGGIPLVSALKSVKLDISNNLRDLDQVGNKYPAQIHAGFVDVKGTVEAYFDDLTLYNKFLNHTSTSLSLTFTDANGLIVNINVPRIYYTVGPVNAAGGNQDVLVALSFEAIRESINDATIIWSYTP